MEPREVVHLPIAHRDRPARFGCDWFEPCAKRHGCTLTVGNQEGLSPQAGPVENPTAVVDACACRRPGLPQADQGCGDGSAKPA